MKNPEIPVGGRLRFFIQNWVKITQDQWVLSLIQEGYKLEFETIPSFNGIKETKLPNENMSILLQEVDTLLQKQAIEKVDHNLNQGFYSTFFLVPKKTGGVRPVINLRPLNMYLRTQHFKMDSMKTVLSLVQKGDYAFSLDLADAYLYLPIFPKHRKFLRFCVNQQVYQFRVMAFGPKVAPRTFTKCVTVVAAFLRQQSLKLSVYLDDWLGLNATKRGLLQDREKLLNLLIDLGFIINVKKSQLVPTQTITYIGGLFHLQEGIVCPTQERIDKIALAVKNILFKKVATAREFLHLLGLLASCVEIVQFARLHMRPIQLYLLHFWKPSSRDLGFKVPIQSHLIPHLKWWLVTANISQGKPFQQPLSAVTLQTDASMFAWGACLGKEMVQGTWSPEERKLHINCLEMEAVYKAFLHFLPLITNQSVLVRSDNTTVVQYLNKQGGTRSTYLCMQTWKIWQVAIKANIWLKAAHIAGRLNVLPDQLSRIRIRPTEWTLNRVVVENIFHKWGFPMIDLFASHLNKQAQIFCTWIPHPTALALDALTISWDRMFAYAFPPICLVPRVVQYMKQFQCTIILIAPVWPRRHWYPELLQLSVANPIVLPVVHNLLSQPQSQILHPNPKVFQLAAWLLSTNTYQQKAFQNELDSCSNQVGDQAHSRIITQSTKNSVAGVLKGKLIYFQQL